jgi:hypothetical protein
MCALCSAMASLFESRCSLLVLICLASAGCSRQLDVELDAATESLTKAMTGLTPSELRWITQEWPWTVPDLRSTYPNAPKQFFEEGWSDDPQFYAWCQEAFKSGDEEVRSVVSVHVISFAHRNNDPENALQDVSQTTELITWSRIHRADVRAAIVVLAVVSVTGSGNESEAQLVRRTFQENESGGFVESTKEVVALP